MADEREPDDTIADADPKGQPGSARPEEERVPPPVEQSVSGADADLIADADLEQGRPADPDVDAAESLRQEGGA